MNGDLMSQPDPAGQPCELGQGSFGSLKTALLLFAWTAAGILVGFFIIYQNSFVGRYHLFSILINLLMLPVYPMVLIWASLGLGPHGDAGFILYLIFTVVNFAVIGLLLGLGHAWYLKRKARHPSPGPHRKSSRLICFGVVLGLLGVAGYCVIQEVLIARDRQFFLQQVDYKEFAQACLDMVVNPDRYGMTFGPSRGDDPKWPEAIRKIKPARLAYHGYSIRISNYYFQGLSFNHSMKEADRYEVVFESNFQKPILLYALQSSNRPKIDWNHNAAVYQHPSLATSSNRPATNTNLPERRSGS